jgi:hypothetical protein
MQVDPTFFKDKNNLKALADIIEKAKLELSCVKIAFPDSTEDPRPICIIDTDEITLETIATEIGKLCQKQGYTSDSLRILTSVEAAPFRDSIQNANPLFSSDFQIIREQPKVLLESLESLEPLIKDKGYLAGATIRFNIYQTITTFKIYSSPTTTVTCDNKPAFDATTQAFQVYTKLAIQRWCNLLPELASITDDYLNARPPHCFFRFDNTLATSSISHMEIYADEKGAKPFCLVYSRPVDGKFSVAPLLDEFEGIFHIEKAPFNLTENNAFFEQKDTLRTNTARFSLRQFLESSKNETGKDEFFKSSENIINRLITPHFVSANPARFKAAFGSALRATTKILRNPAGMGKQNSTSVPLEMASIQVGKYLSYNETAFAFCFKQDETKEKQPAEKDILDLVKLISDKPKPSLSYHFTLGWAKLNSDLQIAFLRKMIPFLIRNKASLLLEDYPTDFKTFVALLKKHSKSTPNLIEMITVSADKHRSKFPVGKRHNNDEVKYIVLSNRASAINTHLQYNPRQFRQPPPKTGAGGATTAPALILAQAETLGGGKRLHRK